MGGRQSAESKLSVTHVTGAYTVRSLALSEHKVVKGQHTGHTGTHPESQNTLSSTGHNGSQEHTTVSQVQCPR